MSYLTVTLTARGREPHNLELLPCTVTGKFFVCPCSAWFSSNITRLHKRKAEKLVLTVSDQLSAVVAISSLDLVYIFSTWN